MRPRRERAAEEVAPAPLSRHFPGLEGRAAVRRRRRQAWGVPPVARGGRGGAGLRVSAVPLGGAGPSTRWRSGPGPPWAALGREGAPAVREETRGFSQDEPVSSPTG